MVHGVYQYTCLPHTSKNVSVDMYCQLSKLRDSERQRERARESERERERAR